MNPMLVPKVRLPDPRIYQTLGRPGIEKLVVQVYHELGRSSISFMFPQDPRELEASALKSALFWVTACGGPPLYEQQFGPPRMRARHLNFHITPEARQEWLRCWDTVLPTAPEELGFPPELIPGFRNYLEDFSGWMVNS